MTRVSLFTGHDFAVSLSTYCPGDGVQDDRPGMVSALAAYPGGNVRFVGAVGATYKFDIASGQSFSLPSGTTIDFTGCSVRLGGTNGRTTDRIFSLSAVSDVHIIGGQWLQSSSDGTASRTDGRVVFSNCTRCSFEPESIDARDASGLNNNVFPVWLSSGTDCKLRGEYGYGTILVAGGTGHDIDIVHSHGAAFGTGQNSLTFQDTDALRLRNPTVRAVIRDCARWGIEIVPSGSAGDFKTRPVDMAIPRIVWTDPGSTAFGAVSAVVAGTQGGYAYIENPPNLGIEGSAVGQEWDMVTCYWDPLSVNTTAVALSYGPATTTATVNVPRGGTHVGILKVINAPSHAVQVGSSGTGQFWGRLTIDTLDAVDPQGHALHLRDNGGLTQAFAPHIRVATIRYTRPPRVAGDRKALVPANGSRIDLLSITYEAASVTAGTDNDVIMDTIANDVEIGALELDTARVDARLVPTFNSGGTARTGWKVGKVRTTGGTTLTFAFSSVGWAGEASATWDPPSIADGAVTSTTVTVTGAKLGDHFVPSFSVAVPAGAFMVAMTTAANTVTVTLFNKTGGALDLASGTLRVARVGQLVV